MSVKTGWLLGLLLISNRDFWTELFQFKVIENLLKQVCLKHQYELISHIEVQCGPEASEIQARSLEL